jgi:hypothetical protein
MQRDAGRKGICIGANDLSRPRCRGKSLDTFQMLMPTVDSDEVVVIWLLGRMRQHKPHNNWETIDCTFT